MILHRVWRSWLARTRHQGSVIYILQALLILLGVAHLYIRTSNYGLIITVDSVAYVSVAENLAAGNGFLTYSQGMFNIWPPLFPLLLAVFAWIGIDPVEAGRVINIIGFGIILWVAYYWLNRHTRNPFLVVISTIALVSAIPLNTEPSWLRTDTLFILFTLLALVKMSLFLKSQGRSWSTLAWSAGFTALAATTRYIGVVIILVGIIVILVRPGFPILYDKLKSVAFYTAISSIPLTVWVTRNYLTSGHLFGQRRAGEGYNYIERGGGLTNRLYSFRSELPDRLHEIYDIIYRWFWIGQAWNYMLYNAWVVTSIVVLVLVGLMLFRRLSRIESNHSPLLGAPSEPEGVSDGESREPINWKLALPFILFVIIYLPFLTVSFIVEPLVKIEARYLAPAYISVLLVVIVGLDRLLCNRARRLTVMGWTIICFILVGLFSSINTALRINLWETSVALADDAENHIHGYTSDTEMIRYLRENPIDGQIYSNESAAIYWFAFARQKSVLFIPYYPDQDSSCLAWVEGLTSDPTYIIYFNKNWAKTCPIAELEPRLSPYLEHIVQTPEATIYRITDP